MKFSKAQIAALVLGYLRQEKLTQAAQAFLTSCSHLHNSDENIKMGKYFMVRVCGLRLEDYLEEYSQIYAIVQTRIEETDCYEHYTRPTLVQQLLYLLDKHQAASTTSTPGVSAPCELEATPAHELPGNSSAESDSSAPKTPKKRNAKINSNEEEIVIDMAEVLAQSLLEKHELHEKIAETINNVRNTPELGKIVSDEHISAGASKELDAVIKTVIERTETDPLYNKLIDEIIGQNFGPTNGEIPKKLLPCSTPTTTLNEDELPTAPQTPLETPQTQPPLPPADPMDDHNNAAIQSIIEASQNADPPLPPTSPHPQSLPSKPDPPTPQNGEVYVFDGNFDTYLKSSGVTNTISANPVYFNPGGLIVVPPPEAPKQFYIVNSQPLLKMVTEKDIMSMPTVIVSDDSPPATLEKGGEGKTKGAEKAKSGGGKGNEGAAVSTSRDNVVATRQASHVRNLDFSTPSCKSEGTKTPKSSASKLWDEDLRKLAGACNKDKSPPRRKRSSTCKKKSKKVTEEKPEKEKQKEEVAPKNADLENREHPGLTTPLKDMVPKTPEGLLDASLHCTPFTAALEEQLEGVDINSLPTPNIPITPGFNLTPGEILGPNQRLTDYSTSSSYYQPSDSDQKMTLVDLIEENKKLDSISPVKQEKAKILENVVLQKGRNSVIAKKNLSLIQRTFSSSSSETESESEVETEDTKKAVVCRANSTKKNNAAAIKDIISNVEVKNTLDEETRKKNLLSHLEEKRQRTIQKIKNPEVTKKQTRGRKKIEKPPKTPKTPKSPKTTKKKTRKKAPSTEENTDEEAQKLVKGLAQRGIHLVHNKTPTKKTEAKEVRDTENDSEEVIFDRKIFEDCEVIVHDKCWKKRNIKTYDFTVLEKNMSANVFIEEAELEVTRTMKWTGCENIFDSTQVPEMDELMDYSIVGSVREESLDADDIKGGKKRKASYSEDNGDTDKRVKTYENNLTLLKKIDVDDFLDKVHGE